MLQVTKELLKNSNGDLEKKLLIYMKRLFKK